jgi:class 3 adenylate cyclase/tetratricopeptide (TPR) repeat protein
VPEEDLLRLWYMPACPHCAEDNPDRARFCWSCGAALAEAPARGAEERKVVSILFVDLVGFTARSDRADPEDVRATLRPYHARLKQEIEHFGGTVEKFIGDAVMAVFGAPVAHEDDAERAVRAALKILEAIDDLNTEQEVELAVRAGVATGEAVVSLDARPEMGEGIATGDVVNTAARLQQAAPVGAVVVGESTFRATRDVIVYDELDPVSVKGKAEAVPLWRASRPRGRFGVDVERRVDVPFVGREHELRLLRDAYTRALQDSSLQLVTMTGEPGVGKTRLISEFQSFVDAQPEIVWWRQGRCLPYGEGITFWALGEIVKAHAGILESDSPDEAGTKLRASVDALVEDETDRDWFRTRLAPLTGAHATEATVTREESFSAWQRFLEAIAAQRPIVLVIEDLHWADPSLVEFLDHLVDWSSGVPLVLLIAARPELYERHPGWGGGKRNSVTISLGPLTDDETARLVASLVGRSVLPAETQTALLERAGGNPLYAEEFVRMLAERGAPAPDAPLPETVQALIAARLDTLPPARKSLLQDAAVVGKVFWTGAVAAIGNIEERDVKEGMREFVRKELVRPARRSSVEGQDELAFWHVLVRDVAYQQIPRAARAEKHGAAASWIEQIAGDRAADHAEILVHHSQQALELAEAAGATDVAELRERLRGFLLLAGERASKLDAQKAYEHYSRALELTPLDDPRRAEMLDRTSDAGFQAGHLGEARELTIEALEQYRSRDDAIGTGRALANLSHLSWVSGLHAEAAAAIEEALELLEAEPPGPDLAVTYSRLAGRAMMQGRSQEALDYSNKAIALAEELAVEERVLFAWQARGTALCELGDPGGVQALRDALALALDRAVPLSAGVAYNNLGHFLWVMESARAGLAAKYDGIDYASRRGLNGNLRWVQMETMWLLFDLGEWDEVLAVAEDLLETLGEERTQLPAVAPAFQSLVLTFRGRIDEAAKLPAIFLPKARELFDPQVVAPALSAGVVVANAQDDSEQVFALTEQLEQLTHDGPDWARLLQTLPVLRACIGHGRLDLGERLFDRPNPHGVRAQNVAIAGQAIIAEARGEIQSAAALYSDAAGRLREYEMPFEQAHALLGYWRCTGDEESLREAQVLFDRLGAVVPQATAEEPRAARRAK